MEELVVELGAVFTLGHLDLASAPTDHAAYIASWLRVLDRDPRAIVTAPSRAQAAADYLIGLTTASVRDPRTAAAMMAHCGNKPSQLTEYAYLSDTYTRRNGAPEGIRTPGLCLRRAPAY